VIMFRFKNINWKFWYGKRCWQLEFRITTIKIRSM